MILNDEQIPATRDQTIPLRKNSEILRIEDPVTDPVTRQQSYPGAVSNNDKVNYLKEVTKRRQVYTMLILITLVWCFLYLYVASLL